MTLDILKTYNDVLSEDEIKTVAKLVALHSTFYNKHDVDTMFAGESDFLGYLSKLASADTFGRICTDERSGYSQYFDHCTNKEKQISQFQPLLTVMIGVPCSGKSTHLQNRVKSVNKDDCPVVISSDNIIDDLPGVNYNEKFKSADFEQIEKQMMTEFQTAAYRAKDIIVDRTNMSKKSRRRFVSAARQNKNNYFVECIVMCTGLDEIMLRNECRANTDGKRIPDYVLHNMMKAFSFPMLDEFDKVTLK